MAGGLDRIERVYAVIVRDPLDGTEGVPAVNTPIGPLPLYSTAGPETIWRAWTASTRSEPTTRTLLRAELVVFDGRRLVREL